MVSLETVQATPRSIDDSSSNPRISFSADTNHHLVDGIGTNLFISITPKSTHHHHYHKDNKLLSSSDPEFEFLSTQSSLDTTMLTADELFSEGKLLPFWQAQKPSTITLKTGEEPDEMDEERGVEPQAEKEEPGRKEEEPGRASGWFVDEDPSPRPPNCTVLFKELLRLKKQRRAASLSPSSSSSSTSSSSSSLGDVAKEKNCTSNVKRAKKVGLERTRSATIRIRPMVNVPICTAVKTSNVLPPLFPYKEGKTRQVKKKEKKLQQ